MDVYLVYASESGYEGTDELISVFSSKDKATSFIKNKGKRNYFWTEVEVDSQPLSAKGGRPLATTIMDFLTLLKQKQAEESLSNTEFASKLGISRQLWEATLLGKRAIGQSLINGALRAYPELKETIFAHIEERARK